MRTVEMKLKNSIQLLFLTKKSNTTIIFMMYQTILNRKLTVIRTFKTHSIKIHKQIINNIKISSIELEISRDPIRITPKKEEI